MVREAIKSSPALLNRDTGILCKGLNITAAVGETPYGISHWV
jgi:hypothetical protein